LTPDSESLWKKKVHGAPHLNQMLKKNGVIFIDVKEVAIGRHHQM